MIESSGELGRRDPMHKRIALVLLAAAPIFCQGSGGSAPEDAPSFVTEGTIDAPVAEVWKVFSSSEGYKLLGVAKAEMDFRIGGLIRSHYSPSGVLGDEGTIENRILAYEPRRMIATRIERPPKSFPFKQAWKSAWTVITLSDLGNNRTHLRVASMGYGADEESQAMRKFFERGNAITLQTLQKHFDRAAGVGRQ